MGRRPASGTETVSWESLYELASGQAGYFSLPQASRAGFSRPRLQYHLETGKLERARRGVFRLRQYPPSPWEDYVVLWLWSGSEGTFSHETALVFHQLSDALPAKVHLTVPLAWAQRRLKVPAELVLHPADLKPADRAWAGPVPVTTPWRTLVACIQDGVSPDLVSQACRQARTRGLLSPQELVRLRKYKAVA
jgi:predicted transcriptional regulator of viral defense system